VTGFAFDVRAGLAADGLSGRALVVWAPPMVALLGMTLSLRVEYG
jgi:hypothetical protein